MRAHRHLAQHPFQQLIVGAFVAVTLAASAGAALADTSSEVRAVDARVLKVKLGGIIDLRLRQGPTAALVIAGDQRYVSKVITTQQGDTLLIDIENNRHLHFGGGNNKEQLRAELTLPNLNDVVSQGVGTTEISGFAGERIHLSLDGAGSVTLTGRYRTVDASLGGVGSMTLNTGDTERVELNLRGAGRIEVNGRSKLLHARLGGVGSLEARELRADAVDLNMSGLGSATVYAKTAATLSLNGLGSATVYGKPVNRKSTASGLGSVSWD
ncbi:MAG: DUF2807 domain-containing protein [Pseudomonadota bacterium]|nr:DUF2807 domain-containing protein [Pseudomonadota bacterium]